jgi:hypothetical protein
MEATPARGGIVQVGPPGSSGRRDDIYSGLNFRMSDGMHGFISCAIQDTSQREPVVNVMLTPPLPNAYFIDDESASRTLDRIRRGARAACLRAIRAGDGLVGANISVPLTSLPMHHVIGTYENIVRAFSPGVDTPWTISMNSIKDADLQQKAMARAQQQAALEQQRVRDAKAALRNKFLSDFNVQAFVSDRQLGVNPFPYKNKVVGVQTVFGQMLSESEALFNDSSAMLVSGVPPTLFGGQARVFLAVRVLGTKTMKTGGGEVILPYGEYVGIYACQQNRCSEFVE